MRTQSKIYLFMLILSGCIGDKSDDNNCLPPSISSLSYTYNGFIEGNHSVQGEVPSTTSSTIFDYNWATGSKFTEYGTDYLMINSNLLYEGKQSNRASLGVQIILPNSGVGKYNIANGRQNSLSLEYAPVWLGELVFSFYAGEVNITYYQCNRIIGTFSGALSAINDANDGELVSINVTDGKFDVKLRAQ
jgi:hypothetical protein